MNRFGIKDEEFLRTKVPMSKEEVRAITMSKLMLKENLKVIDIGAGTGSLSVQIKKLYSSIDLYSIEKRDDAIDIFNQNIKKFNLDINVIKGDAPEGLEKLNGFDRVLIGGSGSNLEQIVLWATKALKKDGIIVANFILLKKATEFINLLEKYSYNVEVINVGVSVGRKVRDDYMMLANNPIYIVRGENE